MRKGRGIGRGGAPALEEARESADGSALLSGLASHFSDPAYVAATARALAAKRDDQRAERVYRHARKLSPLCGRLLREHAAVLFRLGREEEAIHELEAAASGLDRADDERGLIECQLAECLRERGDYGRAREMVEPWLLREKTWDLATFIWVDCVTLSSGSLDKELKLAVEAGRASPAMIHAFLQELPAETNLEVARVIIDAAEETLFPGWLHTIPDLNRLANKILDETSKFRIAR